MKNVLKMVLLTMATGVISNCYGMSNESIKFGYDMANAKLGNKMCREIKTYEILEGARLSELETVKIEKINYSADVCDEPQSDIYQGGAFCDGQTHRCMYAPTLADAISVSSTACSKKEAEKNCSAGLSCTKNTSIYSVPNFTTKRMSEVEIQSFQCKSAKAAIRTRAR